jgi:hypothetical protein
MSENMRDENSAGYNLFLDDERKPGDVFWVNLPVVHWEVVRNYDQFVAMIRERGAPRIVSFDHDLAGEHYPDQDNPQPTQIPYDSYKEKTGYHAAQFLVEHCRTTGDRMPMCYIHTMNPVGGENLRALLGRR